MFYYNIYLQLYYNGICYCFSDKPCAYEQKKKLTAFLLSFFVGVFDADWFYLPAGSPGYMRV
jgi:hypothetical protein